MKIYPFCPKYFLKRFSWIYRYIWMRYASNFLLQLWLDRRRQFLPHICRIAAANPKWLPLCRGNWKVRQNDQYNPKWRHFSCFCYTVHSIAIVLVLSYTYVGYAFSCYKSGAVPTSFFLIWGEKNPLTPIRFGIIPLQNMGI